MVYEAEIRIRRSDPTVLAADFQAVTTLLERRKAERDAPEAAKPRLYAVKPLETNART